MLGLKSSANTLPSDTFAPSMSRLERVEGSGRVQTVRRAGNDAVEVVLLRREREAI